jgi:hypothetical protein
MADLSITETAVLASADAVIENGVLGATIPAGDTVYLAAADDRYELADADGAAAIRRPRGIVLNGGVDGQPTRILKAGDITVNAVLTAGVTYYQSPNPGKICVRADVLTGDYVCIIGVAKSTTVLAVDIQYPDVVSA